MLGVMIEWFRKTDQVEGPPSYLSWQALSRYLCVLMLQANVLPSTNIEKCRLGQPMPRLGSRNALFAVALDPHYLHLSTILR
jgi:hypothetical protein